MKEKSQRGKDKEIKKAIDFVAERLANILLECWWHSKRNKKPKKRKSN